MAQAPKKAAAPVRPAPAPVKPVAKVAPKAAPVVEEEKTPGELTVSAKLSDHDNVLSITYQFGANLADMSELFGEDVVFNKALDSMVIDAQSKLRRHLRAALVGDKDGKKTPLPEDVQSLFDDWKPSAGHAERKSAAEKVQTLVGKLSAEERADLIERLRAAE
jgi:hypothetical protein